MKTNPIYLLKPYEKSMTAKVVEVFKDANETRLILDQTVFYPMGGGQPTDQGNLKLGNGNQVEVYQVMIKDGEIWHYIKSSDEIKVGDSVEGDLNWDRRYKNMKLHSGGHIIDFAMYILGYSPDKLKPQKGDHGKKPFIVYEGTVDKDISEELQNKVNELIEKNIKFSWEFESLEELTKEAIYLQPNLPTNKPMRVLRLEGVGAVADGGTIVENTSEVGKVLISNIEILNGTTTIHYIVEESNPNTLKPLHSKTETTKLLNSQTTKQVDLSRFGIDINKVKETVLNSDNKEELTELWREYLGKDGHIKNAFNKLNELTADERKDFGQSVNMVRNEIDELINKAKAEIEQQKDSSYLNKSQGQLSYQKAKVGHLHPITETTNGLNAIFKSLGYSIMDGPEIETDEYCFQRLNVPSDHPARDLQDSIFVQEPNILMRTQTSSIEAHLLEDFEPPYKVVMPGRVYRNEKVNKSNHFTFHQYQLVVVQEKVSLAELISTIEYLFKQYLGPDTVTRFRNKYYPEVEPGVGPDIQCTFCHGAGCATCKHRGWLEMGGAGIIHPKVLQMAGIDSTKWQGYAFGLGLDRWAMVKHGIEDIRTLLGGNLAYKPNVR